MLPAPEIVALNRMAFGPRPGDLEALMAMGATIDARLTAYIDQQLDPAAIADAVCDAKLAARQFKTLQKTLAQLWADHVVKEGIDWQERITPAVETLEATFLRAVYSRRQLLEVLTDFWHNHFNVYGFEFWSAPVWVHYDRDVIRANVLGNFRAMLGAMAKSPAMLYYLDNISNTSAGPNENFARELFELHALGAENYLGVRRRDQVPLDDANRPVGYIDEDVYGATRSFTGWRSNEETGQFWFDDSVHDRYAKIVLNVEIPSFTGQNDGEKVLDLLAEHPGTGRFIARKLCRRLVADNPPEALVQAAAAVFYAQRNAPDQLKQVVRTILTSAEFRSTWGEKIKRPFEYAVSVLRATNADFAPDDWFYWVYENMGQPLFAWRPPNGYPDFKEDWSSTMPMLQRWRMTNFLMDQWRYGGDGENQDDLRVDLYSQTPTAIRTPVGLVDFWADRVLQRELPASEREPIVEFMAAGRNPTYALPEEDVVDRLRFMVGLLLMAPSFQWR